MNDSDLGILREASGTRAETRLVATSVETGRTRLSAADVATRSQSAFDRCARVGLPQARHVVDEMTYLDFLTTQVVDWDPTEIAQLKLIVAALRPVFAGIDMSVPKVVYLVKTTGREEAAAAYTRHLDTIVLPANMVASLRVPPPGGDDLHPAQTTGYLAGILTHELFHILSKNNPAARARLYAELGFRELAAPLVLPDDPAPCGLPYSALKITNPDAPCLNVWIDLVPPDGTAAVPMMPVLMSRSPYEGGAFFATLEWVFLELDGTMNGWRRGADGQLRLHPSAALLSQYLRRVGRNLTEEIFHPDEILAQSFVIAAQEPSLPLLEQLSLMIWPGRRTDS
ncbi:hypothetical protein ACRDNQ_09925 [Palleronia sp. KMU-117]|uniref:hypothetical protein n=1 Tax=Palleronia sp. KMU-117 TaxID=3434108 RepID=UPI003D74734D